MHLRGLKRSRRYLSSSKGSNDHPPPVIALSQSSFSNGSASSAESALEKHEVDRQQPLRVQTQESSPTPPPIEQSSVPLSLDPHSNPWIKKIAKYKKTPQIIKSRKTQAAPRQVQHWLRHYPRKVGTNFRTQSAQHLVANHLFKLLHAFHIYNNKSKKETIETLLMLGDSNT